MNRFPLPPFLDLMRFYSWTFTRTVIFTKISIFDLFTLLFLIKGIDRYTSLLNLWPECFYIFVPWTSLPTIYLPVYSWLTCLSVAFFKLNKGMKNSWMKTRQWGRHYWEEDRLLHNYLCRGDAGRSSAESLLRLYCGIQMCWKRNSLLYTPGHTTRTKAKC